MVRRTTVGEWRGEQLSLAATDSPMPSSLLSLLPIAVC